ncbi:hypothetical protein MYCTH_2297116 [Thermothelomyces thermophilus ATCC 42464]|uniref:NAD-dependent epimerase/dehydratase domain-containing protein n=1 Tax=Thermothelomyces thermophilus (strain ATCC 42464 / BCRC 31852 / DSM 1799) TaxID=573729 RepID=G2Q489_THET4|nr:uncharacterized protein MYCTH_2297116 [Thermothelomyces thermophilus ATCC 42464]AEO54484.1 hypothetical protein MYCTH_2297116 [Thermothelomyces thermophilus ATCC 42464]
MSDKSAVLVTGSAGHLGKALMLALPELGYTPIGIDINRSPTTTLRGSITDTAFLASVFGTHKPAHVIHAATLHKPHVQTHSQNDFVQTNIAGTVALLEAAAAAGARSFVFVSTTSAFGSALAPPPGQPAAWIDETVRPVPKNIYGVTKAAAEDVCQLAAQRRSGGGGLPVIVLRTSRFFPEEDDDEARRGEVADADNLKVLELACRRVDIADVVTACVCAMERAAAREILWGRYIISAPTPFAAAATATSAVGAGDDNGEGVEDAKKEEREEVLRGLDRDPAAVFERAVPGVRDVFAAKGWRFLTRVDRVYDSGRAVRELGWRPVYTFQRAVDKVARGEEWRSELALKVGKLGYHAVPTGVYTTQERAQQGDE